MKIFRWRGRSVCAAVLFLLVASLAAAACFGSETETWRTVGADEFRRGRLEALAVEPGGRVRLAPAPRVLARLDESGAWSLAVSNSGGLFVGTGDDGRVFRLDAAGKSSLVADLPELEVHALAVDEQGALLAATSPDGKVYRIGAGDKAEVFFDPEDRYIWAMSRFPGGDLLVATGAKARLYRVDRSGKGKVVYDGPEGHVRAIAVGPDGSIYLGTSGRGLVLKLGAEGRARVLLDTKVQEVVSLVFDARGDLFVAAVGEERSTLNAEGASAIATVIVTAEDPGPESAKTPGTEKGSAEQRTGAAPGSGSAAGPTTATAVPPGARIFKIEPDGFPRRIWDSKSETVYALAPEGNAGVYAGTGPDGAIYRIDSDGRATWFGKAESGPVAALLQNKERLLVLGGTPPYLKAMGPGLAEEGTIESRVYDAHSFSLWGKLRWVLDRGSDGALLMTVRTGNTEEPDSTWSDWIAVSGPADGAVVLAPQARFVQWRARLKRGPKGGPALSEVELRFRPRNVAPTIESLTLLPAGAAYQVQPLGSQTGGETQLLPNRYAEAVTRYLAGGRKIPTNARRFYVPGSRTVVWDGTDLNGDDLVYEVDCRREDESSWRTLGKDISESFLTWDSRILPDGWYRLRVIGSDAPSNPDDEKLAGERISDPFVVDNTPPRLEDLESKVSGRKVEAGFRASDSAGRIIFAEYSVDAGNWNSLIPDDRVEDSTIEIYHFIVNLPDEQEHVVVVRAADEGGNWASMRLIPAP